MYEEVIIATSVYIINWNQWDDTPMIVESDDNWCNHPFSLSASAAGVICTF